MAAAESNETKFVDILCCENTKCKKPMVISRREIELYEFRVIDLLYYVFSVSFFLTDIATGEQRTLIDTHIRTYNTHTNYMHIKVEIFHKRV